MAPGEMKGALRWSKLPVGEFTGIDWSRPKAASGFDPYLVWAEASRFAGYHLREQPEWLPVLLELPEGVSIQAFEQAGHRDWLRVPSAYREDAPAGLRYCTAEVGPGFFTALREKRPISQLVKRFELGLPVGQHTRSKQQSGPAQTDRTQLHGKVIGLIDGGLAFANARFLRDGKARTRFFWRQDAQGVGHRPHGLGYGHELTSTDIDQALEQHTHRGMVDEEAVYRGFELTDLAKRANHGTHVMDLACGPRTLLSQVAGAPPDLDAPPSWLAADDDASRADVIAVQLDWSNVIDTSGGSMNVSVMDALMYILGRCTDDTNVAVNLSWGTLAGPHDGTSVLEAAMDQLIELRKGGLQVVVPGGNGYQGRTHTNATLSKGQILPVNWKTLPDDRTQSFLELWISEPCEDVRISVTPPGADDPLPPLRFGDSRMWTNTAGHPVCALIFLEAVATGAHGTCALLALAPTFAFDASAVTSPCGTWKIALTNDGNAPVTIDAYIERDDVALGQNTGARQSRFEDALYDTSGDPDSFVDRPVGLGQQLDATVIRRSGVFNSLSTGRKTISVAGERIAGERWARYSPPQPDPDASRPQRPGVVRVPSQAAYSDDNPALLGVLAAGTYSGSTARLVGTSSAAPQVTRKVFNLMEAVAAPRQRTRRPIR